MFTKYVFTITFHHPLIIILQKIVSITKIVETMKLYKITNLFLKEYHWQYIDINLSVVVEKYMYSIT